MKSEYVVGSPILKSNPFPVINILGIVSQKCCITYLFAKQTFAYLPIIEVIGEGLYIYFYSQKYYFSVENHSFETGNCTNPLALIVAKSPQP
jgi:hypothetical protein